MVLEILGPSLDLSLFLSGDHIANRKLGLAQFPELQAVYLPDAMVPLMPEEPFGTRRFIEDDNRGAVSPEPVASLDGTDFFFSVKGIGSTTDPFSFNLIDSIRLSSIVHDPGLRGKLQRIPASSPRFITGELWLRGSPYGGQGLEHASAALKVSEMADSTSINGFRIAPVIGIVMLPDHLETEIKQLFWYRRFGGRIVQELRLVPSNVRVYFHSNNVIGRNITRVYDMFGIDSNEKAHSFEVNFIRSGIAMLTLFPRTLGRREDGRYTGLDFNDVWLDKDAVISPDGTVYFVDLEGIETIAVDEELVEDKIEEQVYRSLYEFMFAYEQIEHERCSRFGRETDRRTQFEILVREAVKEDPFIDAVKDADSLKLVIKNKLDEKRIYKVFPIVDRGTV